ncbi:hypothetical protein [Nostoc sp.]
MNKQVDVWEKFQPMNLIQAMSFVWSQWHKQHLPKKTQKWGMH